MKGSRRSILVAVGVGSFAGGVIALAGPAQSSAVLKSLLGVVSAVVAVGTGVRLYRTWSPTDGDVSPTVERGMTHSPPGTDLDRTLAAFGPEARGYLPDRWAVHDRLGTLAARVLARERGCSLESARTRIDAGEWPEDELLSRFLRDPDATLPRTRADRLRALFPGSFAGDDGVSDFQELYRRSVDALVDRSQLVDRADPTAAEIGHLPTDGTTADGNSVDRRGGDRRPVQTHESGRWRTLLPLAIGFVAVGLLVRTPTVALAGAVPLGLAVYRHALPTPDPSLTIDRTVEAGDEAERSDVEPGDRVEISVTVHNAGDRTLPDLRVVDGVPPGLSVVEGSPRLGTTLRPGSETRLEYTIEAERGRHAFDSVAVHSRGLAGSGVRREDVGISADSDRAITCVPSLEALPRTVPLFDRPGEYLGRLPAAGGEGVEFFGVREYQPGDSTNRIDWKRLARSPSAEPTTVEFRQHRAGTVALVVDATRGAYVAPDAEAPSALERSIDATGRLFGSLLASGDRVGVAAFGPTPLWLDPDTGLDHHRRVESALATSPAFDPRGPTDGETPHWTHWVRDFHRRFPPETQVLLLSPLCERWPSVVIRRLRSYGHPVTVISPDVTADATVGQRLVRAERRLRIASLRESGVRVIDWDSATGLSVALDAAASRWSS
jgi:uncharacterized repeat protein (TIGR01451 family)